MANGRGGGNVNGIAIAIGVFVAFKLVPNWDSWYGWVLVIGVTFATMLVVQAAVGVARALLPRRSGESP